MRSRTPFLALTVLGLSTLPATAAEPYDWAQPAAREVIASGAWSPASGSDLARSASRRELAAGLRLLAEDAERRAPVAPVGEDGAASEADDGEFPDRTDVPGEPGSEIETQAQAVPETEIQSTEPDADLARRARALATGLERRPGARVTARLGHRIVVRALGFGRERAALSKLALGPNRPRLPAGFATEILARELGLRHNYPSRHERHERGGSELLTRADVAGMIAAARGVDEGDRLRLSRFRTIDLPATGRRRAAVVTSALRYVGHVYVWGGDWPNPGSPWGWQAHGGFDCSGLAWMTYKGARRSARLGIGRALGGRTADDMAWERPSERILATAARAGDLVFFGEPGRRSQRGDISHMGISLGNGWMIHSSGSRAGVSISHLADYWPDGLSHARRVRALEA